MNNEKMQLIILAAALGWLIHEFLTQQTEIRREVRIRDSDLTKRIWDLEQKIDFVREVRGLKIEIPKNPEPAPEVTASA